MTLQLLHGDCLELMKTLPDKSIDLFLCDLPYGCLTGGAGKEKAKRGEGNVIGGCAWDIKIDLTQFWVQVKRLCKDDHTPVIHFCNAKFGFELYNSNRDWFRYDLVWSKTNAVGFLLANKMPMRSHENIYVFAKKGANYNRVDITGDFPNTSPSGKGRAGGDVYNQKRVDIPAQDRTGVRCVKSVIETSNKKGKGKHPTQKPDDLYEWLITRYSKEGDTILDPTAGSFASCFTAQRLNRNAIGIEMDDGFYDRAFNIANK